MILTVFPNTINTFRQKTIRFINTLIFQSFSLHDNDIWNLFRLTFDQIVCEKRILVLST